MVAVRKDHRHQHQFTTETQVEVTHEVHAIGRISVGGRGSSCCLNHAYFMRLYMVRGGGTMQYPLTGSEIRLTTPDLC